MKCSIVPTYQTSQLGQQTKKTFFFFFLILWVNVKGEAQLLSDQVMKLPFGNEDDEDDDCINGTFIQASYTTFNKGPFLISLIPLRGWWRPKQSYASKANVFPFLHELAGTCLQTLQGYNMTMLWVQFLFLHKEVQKNNTRACLYLHIRVVCSKWFLVHPV